MLFTFINILPLFRRVCQSLKADLGSATFKIPVEDVDSSHEYDAGNETTLNILFDNSYSWFSAKTLRYSSNLSIIKYYTQHFFFACVVTQFRLRKKRLNKEKWAPWFALQKLK